MKAGKLTRVIRIERSTASVNDYGTPTNTWSVAATLRAEVVERSTEEFLRAQGAVEEAAIVFRTRYASGITNADRVSFDGQSWNIREVSEIGRRQGLELRCVEVT